MRRAFALAGAALALALSAGTSAWAGSEFATRCGNYGCDHVRCDYSGNHCVRYSDYDERYNGYVNGYASGYDNGGGYYGGYGDYGAPSDNGTYSGRGDYGSYRQPYDNGYYGGYDSGYGSHLVCDNAGSRCYRTSAPYWSHHEYYRLHGYRWQNR
jgi:hypothetical protein